MSMKKSILAIFTLAVITAQAQVTVVTGSPKLFNMAKQPAFSAMSRENEHSFVFKHTVNALEVYTLVTADNAGNIKEVKELKINNGVFNNASYITGVYLIGGKLVAVIENPDKTAGLNRLSLRLIENGEVSTKDIPVGAMEFEKLMNQGNWFVSVTQDQDHLAVVGQMPRDKDEPNRYKYFFLDASLQVTKKGQLSFPDDSKRVNFHKFHASDKGDLYLIETGIEKSYKYINVFKASVTGSNGSINAVQPADPSQKIMSYTSAVNEAGDLIIAGYYKKKAGIVVGDEEGRGSWWYSSADGKMTVHEFEKPVSNLNAFGLVKNGHTWFLVGGQYKADREAPTGVGTMKMEENYNYKHHDVWVTAFEENGARKFDIPLAKNYTARNFDADLYPAFGILNGKLAVVYNDHYGKYFPGDPSSTFKLPVLVYISNDGLMEPPVHFAKELQGTGTSYTLYPRIFTSGKKELVLLSGNGTAVKGVVFK